MESSSANSCPVCALFPHNSASAHSVGKATSRTAEDYAMKWFSKLFLGDRQRTAPLCQPEFPLVPRTPLGLFGDLAPGTSHASDHPPAARKFNLAVTTVCRRR